MFGNLDEDLFAVFAQIVCYIFFEEMIYLNPIKGTLLFFLYVPITTKFRSVPAYDFD